MSSLARGRKERMMENQKLYVPTLEGLRQTLASLPEGTTADVLSSDLEAGNFEIAHLEIREPGQYTRHVEIEYSGPVAEGYVSPFEAQSVEADL